MPDIPRLPRSPRICLMLTAAISLLGLPLSADAAPPTYWQEVRPILRKHCTVCHSEKTRMEYDVSGGIALDTYENILKGNKTPLVRKGKGGDSPLVAVLRHPKPSRRMPLDAEPLDDADVARIRDWIDAGLPEGERPKETDPAAVVGPGKGRKLDVVLATRTPLPKLAAGPGQTGPLELVLPIGPLAPITALVFSPEGRFLATGSYGRVVIWDLASGAPARMLTNVLGAVNDIRFSPDGKLLAVAGGQPSARGDIRLYEVDGWKLAGTLGGHADVVASLAFHPGGKLLASASFDKTVRIWDLETRQVVLNYTGHSDFVHAVAFGPGGEWFATASKDRTSRLVETRTGKSLLTYSGIDTDVLAVAVRPDGEQVVSSGFDPALHWWNSKTGERVRRQAGHNTATHELVFAPSGEFAVSAGADRTARIWDAKTGVQSRSLPVNSMVYAVAVRGDGKLVASGSFDGLVRVWDQVNTRLLATLLAAPGGDWLALTPEAFCGASDGIAALGRWRTSGQFLPGERVWPAVRKAGEVARALKLEKVGEPAFAAPPPMMVQKNGKPRGTAFALRFRRSP